MSKDSEQITKMQKLQALGQFAGGIAHDFNNILSIIEGYTYGASKALRAGSLKEEDLQKILNVTGRGASLTKQLLAFSRQSIMPDTILNLSDILKSQEVLLTPLFGGRIQYVLNIPSYPVWIRGAEDQLTQVILNLALNARDVMGDRGVFEINLTQEKGHAILRVRDTGRGIAPELLPHIFEPFFTTKDQGEGTGLGLSVVFGIINQMDGLIDVVSTEGAGTTFEITLPLQKRQIEHEIEEMNELFSADLRGKTLLLAEDEPELRDILALTLSDMEMTVLTASNGNDALRIAEEYMGDIDFLLTDIVMPEMDGVTLGEHFAEKHPDTNVVYMSGYPMAHRGVHDAGYQETGKQIPDQSPFIAKPMQEQTIRDVLERALSLRNHRTKTDDTVTAFPNSEIP